LILSGRLLAENGPDERPQDEPEGREEEGAGDHPDERPPEAALRGTELAGAGQGHGVIKDHCQRRQGAHDDQECRAERLPVAGDGKEYEPQEVERRSGQPGKHAAGEADELEQSAEDDQGRHCSVEESLAHSRTYPHFSIYVFEE